VPKSGAAVRCFIQVGSVVQKLGLVFNSRCERSCIALITSVTPKLPNFKLKTWFEQLLGFLPLTFALKFYHMNAVYEFSGKF
jgi:hypothetical protein